MTMIGFLPLVSAVVAFGIASVLRPSLDNLLRESNFVADNYRGEPIPKGMGVVVPLASFGPIVALLWIAPTYGHTPLWLALLFGMAFLGLFDDAAGDRRHGGFSQHLRALLQGKTTTGALKAVYGGVLCLYAGWSLTHRVPGALLAALVIALATNTINLLDVRPGRALKGYGLLIAVGMGTLLFFESSLAAPGFHVTALAATAGSAAALWRGDLQGEYMLGDAGANVLGVSAGLLLVGGPPAWQVAWLALFIVLHILCEKRSLTELIERVSVLNRIDRWGRP